MNERFSFRTAALFLIGIMFTSAIISDFFYKGIENANKFALGTLFNGISTTAFALLVPLMVVWAAINFFFRDFLRSMQHCQSRNPCWMCDPTEEEPPRGKTSSRKVKR